jgi:hypothetical protein
MSSSHPYNFLNSRRRAGSQLAAAEQQEYNRWREFEVSVFLQSYKSHCVNRKGKALWSHIQQDLQKRGIQKTPYNIEKKWNNLLNRFNKSNSLHKFPFYHEVAAILQERRGRDDLMSDPSSPCDTSVSVVPPTLHVWSQTPSSQEHNVLMERPPSPITLKPIQALDVLIHEFHLEKKKRQDSFPFFPFLKKLQEILDKSC